MLTSLSTVQLVIICVAIAVVVAIIVAGVAFISSRASSRRLRSRFGPEYGRAVEESGSQHKAEGRLHAREQRVRKYHLKPLTAQEKERLRAAWKRVQVKFVDSPKDATASADDLLGQAMTARGYPAGDFQQRLEDLSVDHGGAVQNYRTAHDLAARHSRGEASTEDMRQAIIQYRTLLEELLGEDQELQAAS
jgi:hypothetical protein